MNCRSRILISLLLGTLVGAMPAYAGEIQIISADVGSGQGLEDPTAATPVGGNPGTTRGEQALVVFQFAADLWGSVLQSDVPVLNEVSFQPLTCDATSGVLGGSGTNYIFVFNSGPTLPTGAIADTWYHSALGDALAATDLNVLKGRPADTPDIVSVFNGDLGKPGCLTGSGWYFGLDGATPSGQINFLDVVMHEMAHGLGFSGFGNLSTGRHYMGTPDIYSTFVRDNTSGLMWNDMTNRQRKNAALDDGNLVFTGAQVQSEAGLILNPGYSLNVTSPGSIAGTYDFLGAQFGPPLSPANYSGSVAVPTSSSLACNAGASPAPVTGVAGMIALVDRGSCAFTEKASNAQAGGAVAVMIANNVAGLFSPGGVDPGITIPVAMVRQSTGASIGANLPVTVVLQQSGHAGTDVNGNVQLYAPAVLDQGSSFSHYDIRLTPNAIMEFSINADLDANLSLDLTPALFSDIGWNVNAGNQFLLTCDTGVPTSIPGGVIVGANIYASARMLAASSADVAAYRQAMLDYVDALAADGLITAGQGISLSACLDNAQSQQQYGAWNADAIFANGFDA